jgi:hypothetical protein
MLWVAIGVVVLLVIGVALGVATAADPDALTAARAELRRRTGLLEVQGSEGTSLIATRALGRVRYEHRSHTEGSTEISVGSWRLEPTQPLRVRLRLIEKRLAPQSPGKRAVAAATDAVMGSRRTVGLELPGPVPIGEPSLDARFLAFTDEPSVLVKIAADPQLVAQLLACAELDLVLGPEGVTLHDPARLNLGALMAPVSPLKTQAAVVARATIVAHERVLALLEHIASRVGNGVTYR